MPCHFILKAACIKIWVRWLYYFTFLQWWVWQNNWERRTLNKNVMNIKIYIFVSKKDKMSHCAVYELLVLIKTTYTASSNEQLKDF